MTLPGPFNELLRRAQVHEHLAAARQINHIEASRFGQRNRRLACHPVKWLHLPEGKRGEELVKRAQRLAQRTLGAEQEGNEQASQAPIAVQERVDGLELDVSFNKGFSN